MDEKTTRVGELSLMGILHGSRAGFAMNASNSGYPALRTMGIKNHKPPLMQTPTCENLARPIYLISGTYIIHNLLHFNGTRGPHQDAMSYFFLLVPFHLSISSVG